MIKHQKQLYEFIKKDDCKSLSSLLNEIDDKEFSDNDKGTPIQYAIKKNNIAACKILLENSFPTEAFDECGTAVLSALLNSNLDALDLLINYGASIDSPLQKQSTTFPLTYSYYLQDIRFSEKLLDLGANPEVMSEIKGTDKDGNETIDRIPAVFAAAQTGNIDIFELAIKSAKNFFSEKGISLFWYLLVPDDRTLDQYQNRAIKIMLEKGVPLKNACTDKIQGVKETAFTLLFRRNMDKRERIVRERLILSIIKDHSRNEEFASIPITELLELAVFMSSKKLVKYFLEKLSALHLEEGHFSALHMAASLRDSNLSAEFISLLLEKVNDKDRSKIDYHDDAGKSAFELAIQYNNYESASILLDHGASIVNTIDSDDEQVPLWVQLVCHLHYQTDVDRLEDWIDKGLSLRTFKPKDLDCELNFASVIAARIVLQSEFKVFEKYHQWRGYYDPDNGYPILNLSNLLSKIKNAQKLNSRLEDNELVFEEIEGLINGK